MLEFTLSGNAWFDSVPQPVLLAKHKRIEYFNPAAKALFAAVDIPLGEGLALPTGFPTESDSVAQITLADQTWIIQSCPLEDKVLYQLQPLREEDGMSLPRLNQLATEFRALLSPLSAAIETLEQSMVETEQLRTASWVSALNQQHYKLLRFVQHLDFYSQSTEDLMLFYPLRELDFGAVCQELDHTLSYMAELMGHHFSYKGSEHLFILGNATLLERLVYNLVSNALRAGGDISMTLKVSHHQAVLRLSDTAGGIDPAKMSALFTPNVTHPLDLNTFYQEGFGLGIPICQRIADLHGGQLFFTRSKKGTSVTLSLPLPPEGCQLTLRSDDLFTSPGYNDVLVELSDVLPSSCYTLDALT
jgi:signal transduction histidine kinase